MASQATTQIRVSPSAHRTLRRLSKASGAPVTKIVDRLVKREVAEASARERGFGAGGDPRDVRA